VVRLLGTAEHGRHLCLVFEPLALNLKEVLDRYGRGVGLNLGAVRAYAKQMLLGLHALRSAGLVHADLKPHNVLVSESFHVAKIADLGSAFAEAGPENAPTPLLVSRFYRAPEVILGFKHSSALDMWALGCVLYELYTGQVLFPGEDNNAMLWRHQRLRGRMPSKLVRRHLAAAQALRMEAHFDAALNFIHETRDPVSGAPVAKAVALPQAPPDDLGAWLLAKRADDDDRRAVLALKDLLERMLALDPAKRISVADALRHAFVAA
jgi:serine/threonine-protein kinase PRP4